jgi:glyoxylase-like metal-dependent hydrolase (beta-lactamase superfamily II)
VDDGTRSGDIAQEWREDPRGSGGPERFTLISRGGDRRGMFTRIAVPTPFQVGAVNTYLAGRTLVDPGPASEEAWTTLLSAMEERDLAPEDVERVLITHSHIDHFGLAKRLQDRGAKVYASAAAATVMEDFPAYYDYERGFFTEFFERHGMAPTTAETVTSLSESYLAYAPSVTVDERVGRGDAIPTLDTELTVDEVAGHAPGELLFGYDDGDDRIGLVGDNVLEEITPNPVLQPPPEEGAERPRVLPAFNASLDRLAGEGYDRFLPGHRGTIEDPAGRIAEIREAHEERTGNVHDLLDGPTTAVDVMEGLFGELPVTERFPGMSEAIGHLDVLEERGRVQRREEGGLVVYERTD